MPEKLYRYFSHEIDRLDAALLQTPPSGAETETALLRRLRSITTDEIRRWSETLADPGEQERRIAA